MNNFPRSAYVHIPFCHRRCFYCDFAIIPLGNTVETVNGYGSKTVKEYLYFLHKEILSIKHKSPLSTIYVGGGTPSILDPKQIKELIDLFKENYGIDYGAEITMEVDPASFNQDDLLGFINAGLIDLVSEYKVLIIRYFKSREGVIRKKMQKNLVYG